MLESRHDIASMNFQPFAKKAAYDDLMAVKQLIYMANLDLSPADILKRVVDYYGPVLKEN